MCRECDRAARDEGWTGLTASCGCLAEAVRHGYHRTDGTCTRKPKVEKPKHGFTCGICSWGRDSVHGSEAYEQHMAHVHGESGAPS